MEHRNGYLIATDYVCADGKTDVSGVLQQLIDSNPNRTIFFPDGTYLLRKKPLLAAACPVVSNGVIVGLVLSVSFNLPVLLTMAEVAIGEVGAVAIGMIILGSMKRARIDLSRLG